MFVVAVMTLFIQLMEEYFVLEKEKNICASYLLEDPKFDNHSGKSFHPFVIATQTIDTKNGKLT